MTNQSASFKQNQQELHNPLSVRSNKTIKIDCQVRWRQTDWYPKTDCTNHQVQFIQVTYYNSSSLKILGRSYCHILDNIHYFLERSIWITQFNRTPFIKWSYWLAQIICTDFLNLPDWPIQIDGTTFFHQSHWIIQINSSTYLD